MMPTIFVRVFGAFLLPFNAIGLHLSIQHKDTSFDHTYKYISA